MKSLVYFMMIAVLAACARTPEFSRPDYSKFVTSQELKSVDRIRQFKMIGWHPLDDHFFILSASIKRHYLIEMMGFCHDLSYVQTIRLNQSMRGILQSKFDSITIDTYPNPSRQCTIGKIYEITPEQKSMLVSDKRSYE